METDNKSQRVEAQIGFVLDKGLRSENQDMHSLGVIQVERQGGGMMSIAMTGVFDGHGTFGRSCATRVRDIIQEALSNPSTSPWIALASSPEAIQEQVTASLTELFLNTQNKLISLTEDKSAKLNSKFSGTTAVISAVSPTHICCANTGDSDCVLGTLSEDGSSCESTLLNTRHQLTIESEKKRIEEAGGRVETQRARDGTQMDGPLRVWLKDIQTPGLMVSRSLGDVACHEIGVSHEPYVVVREIGPRDVVLVSGSDGLFEFVSHEDCVAFAEDHIDPTEAAHGLAMWALSLQNTRNADNVTVIVHYLESLESRKSRLESKPGFTDKLEERRRQAKAYEEEYEKLKDDQKKSVMAALGGAGAEGPSTGSIIYGGAEASSDDKKPAAGFQAQKPPPVDETEQKKSSACVVS